MNNFMKLVLRDGLGKGWQRGKTPSLSPFRLLFSCHSSFAKGGFRNVFEVLFLHMRNVISIPYPVAFMHPDTDTGWWRRSDTNKTFFCSGMEKLRPLGCPTIAADPLALGVVTDLEIRRSPDQAR